jgi:hypothetical protein
MSKMRFCVAAAVLACSSFSGACGSSSGQAEKDSGLPDTVTPKDAPHDAIVDTRRQLPDVDWGGNSDASPGTGTLLTPGYGLLLYGVTSDGYVIYSTSGEVTPYFAVPLTGGSPVIIAKAVGYSYAAVSGHFVYLYLNLDVSDAGEFTYGSPLSVWSSATGLHSIANNGFITNAAPSSDSMHVLYIDNFDVATSTGDLYVASPDGSGAQPLQTGMPGVSATTMCLPNFAFAGTTAVVSYCPDGMTTTNANVQTYTSTAWAETNTLTAYKNAFVADPTDTNLLIASTTTGLSVVPLAGGTPTPIDTTGTQGVFTSDGMHLVYATSASTLVRTPVASPSPTPLVTAGVSGIYTLSPDGNTALGPGTGDDLFTASAVTAGSLTTLSSTTMTAVGGVSEPGSAFTADSSHVLYFTGAAVSSTDGFTYGTLNAVATGSSTPTMLASNSTTVWAATGAKVVFDQAVMLGSDISSVDLSGTSPPTPIATDAIHGSGAAFYMSAAGDKIIYSWTAPGTSTGGIYVAAVP